MSSVGTTPGTPNVLPTRNRSGYDDRNIRSKERRRLFHLAFAIVLALCGVFVITYFILFVYTPNRDFMNQKNEECVILSANLACWRRKILSSSHLEQGKFTCWHFVVQHPNSTALVQHNNVDDFPIENNQCLNEESCGMESWPCKINRTNPSKVILRWSFPVSDAIYCAVGLISVIIFGILAIWRYVKDSRSLSNTKLNNFINADNNTDRSTSIFPTSSTVNSRPFDGHANNDSSNSIASNGTSNDGNAVPFSLKRKRTPTWSEQQEKLSSDMGYLPRDSGSKSPPSLKDTYLS